MIIGLLLSCLYLLKLTSSQTPAAPNSCGPGCLLCSRDGQCLLCDFTQSLFFNGAQCAKFLLENCETYDPSGACLVCKANHYLETNLCKPVPENKIFDNCDYFDPSLTTCHQCRPGFFRKDGKCARLARNITNCAGVFEDGLSCVSCAEGVPGYTFQNCTQPLKVVPNCRGYGFLECLQCASGYMLEGNNYIFSALVDIKKPFLANYRAILEMQGSLSANYPVCRKVEILNCEVFERFDKCQKCQSSFFLTANSTCQSFPEPRIKNCEVFHSANTCKLCGEGFYRKFENECAAVTPIANCASHNRFADKICDQCSPNHYLFNNQCEPRAFSKAIPNCEAVFHDRDLCRLCAGGFLLNLDFASCIPNVNNCRSHVILAGAAQCAQCFPGFFLTNDFRCEKGAIPDCEEYGSPSQCLACGNGAYASEDKAACLRHSLASVLACARFSPFQQNYCEGCLESQVRFAIANFCAAVDLPIENCAEFSSGTACARCNSTIGYLEGGECRLGTVKRCREYDRGQNMCLACEPDLANFQSYVPDRLAVNNTCVVGNPNLFFNCKEIGDSADNFCQMCNSKHYPVLISASEFQYCLPEDFAVFPESPKVANCSLFDSEQNMCRICHDNLSGFFQVSYLGSCLNECPEGTSAQTFEFETKRVSGRFICKQASVFQAGGFLPQFGLACQRYDYDQSGSFVCAQCGPGKIALFDEGYNSQRTHSYAYLLTSSTNSFYSAHNRIMAIYSCLSATAGSLNSAGGTQLMKSQAAAEADAPDISNCYMLAKVPASNWHACLRCGFGYSGKLVRTANAKAFMVEKCELVTDCKVDLWLNGLAWGSPMTFPLDFYLTCHVCAPGNSPSQIPTFGLASATVTSVTPNIAKDLLGPFGIPGANSADLAPLFVDPTSLVRQTSCQSPGLTQSVMFPASCGAQALYIDKRLNFYILGEANAETNPLCMACLPGFRAIYSAVVPFAVKVCEKIAKCAFSNTFNICELCETGYALASSSNNKQCLISKVEFCQIVDDNEKCLLCKAGYILSTDGTCDQINTFKCARKGFYAIPANLEQTKSLFMEGIGCQKCESKFVLATFSKPLQLCVQNKLIETNNEEKNNSTQIFINNCDFYGLEGQTVICRQCKPGFIIQENKRFCWADTLFENCKILANGGSRCATCASAHFYDNLLSKCAKGAIARCLVYSNQDNCLECEPGFLAVSITGGRTLCFQTDQLNCERFERVQALFGTLECELCSRGHFLNKNSTLGSFPLKACLKIPEVPNCKVYNKELDVSQSFLTCLECTADYFLDRVSQTCKRRSGKIANCKTHSLSADTCHECGPSFFLEVDARSCRPNPVGIVGCIDYSSETACLKCDFGQYLEDNSCKIVEETKLIKNCKYYKNGFECLECVKNFYLENNVCEQALASNCKTFVDSKTCATCEHNYGLSQSFNITSCLLVQVKNCELPDLKSAGPNFTCLKCAPNYYLTSAKQCAPVTTKLISCKYYKNQDTCSQCADSLLLAYDGKKCLNVTFVNQMLDPKCLNSQQVYTCNACKPGFILEKGLCVECRNNTLAQGCWQCNPYNQNECLMCGTGTVHTKDRVCEGANYAITNSNSTSNGTNNSTGGVGLVRGVILIVVMVLQVLFLES